MAKLMWNSPILRDLTVLELIPGLFALFIWAHLFENKKLTFRIDNIALVAITNKITLKSKLVMKLMRPVVFLSMKHNIQFRAVHTVSQMTTDMFYLS
jgi:hypothetical protein